MLQQIETMFDNKEAMLKKLKKKSYEQRMWDFREKNGHYFDEMTAYVGSVEDEQGKKTAAEEVAKVLTEAVYNHFQKKGKMNGRVQADLNFFMIYFVFPALLLTDHADATLLADTICSKWGSTFKNSNIGYTTYQKLYDSFRNKILGIF